VSVFSTPAYYRGTVYYVGTPYLKQTRREPLKAFHSTNGLLSTMPTLGSFTYGFPGSTPSVSAKGAANGIVWTLDYSGEASSAILRAYEAGDVSHELYDSTQAGMRDQGGPGVKFVVPTVVNGKVFAAGSGVVTVYGLLPQA